MKLFPDRRLSLGGFDLLAQVRVPLLGCICDEDCDEHGCCDDQEYFHAHRIAQSLSSVLCSGFADAQQLCNGETNGIEK